MNRDKEAINIHTLLELYQLLVDIEEEYNTSDSILKKQKVLDDLRNVREIMAYHIWVAKQLKLKRENYESNENK